MLLVPLAERRRELRDAGDVILEVAEHLVRLAFRRVARDALAFAEEHERAALLGVGHRVLLSAREAVDRARCECQRELELGDRAGRTCRT